LHLPLPLIRKPAEESQLPPPDEEAVLRALAHGSENERWAAARAAAELPNSVAALGSAVARETSPRVREAMLTALARIATPQSVEVVLPLLRSDDAEVRTGASDALAAMAKATWPYLAALLRDTDEHVRVLACELLRNLPGEQAVPLLCQVLESEPEANVCAAAVDALAEIGGASALPALTRCAERFRATPFLQFAIGVAIDRLRSQSLEPHA
jgi:HEAT repeat protein